MIKGKFNKYKNVRNKNFKCILCSKTVEQLNELLNYYNVSYLATFLNEKGNIKNRNKTNSCAKHQRKIRINVIRARTLGFLPHILE